jgi:hypothetical protein
MAKYIIPQMYSRRIKSPQDILNCITWHSSGRRSLVPYEERWKSGFEHYLCGKGRTIHPMLTDDLLTDEERAVAPGDALYHGERFLNMVTGSPLLPDPGMKIRVCTFTVHQPILMLSF